MRSIFVQLYFNGVSINTKDYQWGYVITRTFFREKVNELFQGLEYIRVYLDDILVFKTRNWNYHLTK